MWAVFDTNVCLRLYVAQGLDNAGPTDK